MTKYSQIIQSRIKKLVKTLRGDIYLNSFIDSFLDYSVSLKNHPNLYLVGGSVRDAILNIPSKDYDFVIEGMSKKELTKFLEKQPGKSVDVASRNFGVFKYQPKNSKNIIDIALPRLDVYQEYGKGHSDVDIKTNNKISIKQDLERREFTINALAVNLKNNQLIDYFQGIDDIIPALKNKQGIIRTVGDPYLRLVQEDPTRMLRAIRFACKLNFIIEAQTYRTIKQHYPEITKTFKQKYIVNGIKKYRQATRVSQESIASELVKGFNANPDELISHLDDTKIYQVILPVYTIKAWDEMKKTDHPPEYHSEGNVWKHTLLALKNIGKISENKLGLPKDVSINLKFAVLFHDIGKPETFVLNENKYTYYNHPEAAAEIAKKTIRFLKLSSPFSKKDPLYVDAKKVEFLVKNHHIPFNVNPFEIKDRKLIKYFLENEPLGQELLQLAYIDATSSKKAGNLPPDYTSIKNFIKRIKYVKNKLISPISNDDLETITQNTIMLKSINQQIPNTYFVSMNKLVKNLGQGKIINNSDVRLIDKLLIYLEELNLPKKFDQISLEKCKTILVGLISSHTPYPVSGDQIKNMIGKYLQENKKIPAENSALLKNVISSNRGGKLIGEIKEIYLEDRLSNPSKYIQKDAPKNKHLQKVLVNYLSNIFFK